MSKENYQIRPFARLLTMLGEQLIKNERIALAELAKNSYDADASWVKISFLDFTADFQADDTSRIVIEDDGGGMSLEIIRDHWLRPATPVKKIGKQSDDTTPKGRKIQGEKGIGRFAMLKLGKKSVVTTRPRGGKKEFIINFDFSRFDDDFLSENGTTKELYLDQLSIEVDDRTATEITSKDITLGGHKIVRKPHGTRIEISDLKGVWNEKKVRDVFRDLTRLQSIFDKAVSVESENFDDEKNFSVYIYADEEEQPFASQYVGRLLTLLDDSSVFRIEDGAYDQKKRAFSFKLNGQPHVLSLNDPDITGIRVFREHFGKAAEELKKRQTECGSFTFGFYVFDFSAGAEPKYLLDKQDKELIKDHRIYLYRDGIRVYPYGEPEDDWLRIDQYRGTISAGQFLSNDQVVGYINISEKGNPGLKDKTNREGLIETGNPTDDFICLLQTFLAFVRAKPYAQYRMSLLDKKIVNVVKEEQVQKDFGELKNAIKDNKNAVAILDKAEKRYKAERQFLIRRAETTEDLAGVGLSVETASHDITSVMTKALEKMDGMIRVGTNRKNLDLDSLFDALATVRGMMGFIDAQLHDIQLLFRSAKQRRRDIRVRDVLDKVVKIYENSIRKAKIELEIEVIGGPLVAKTTDAVLLQLLLNLFDNAVFWLDSTDTVNKKIKIQLDGKEGLLIFSDNGPGIRAEDAEYIFEPFYSGKGEEGRGLGLYIARQLLERHDYSIELADIKAHKIMQGANFVISFVKGK
ncbi:ATP-binding protein [Collimonas pratensis]|uniref:histidine kinase n=1 Tax=Collimonas pratensis TaxID=279113 RepID=A0A127Q9H3_9BURK|nr:ATP-binding protein [Collimonas pratensis]AMP06515.1 histidine kinase-, DNA gyrase B-, and HSP90-like ATPase family protein [Collimonas pratensis]